MLMREEEIALLKKEKKERMDDEDLFLSADGIPRMS
jgi:hypothetical protein